MKKLTAILHKTDGTGQAGRWALPVTVWLSLLWLELLLILGGGRTLAAGTLLYVVLFSAAAAGVISLLVTVTRSRRVNFVVLIVLLGIVTVFFGVEFYCRAFFKNYMSPLSVLTGAKGVVGGFFGTMIGQIAKRIWALPLLFVPLAAVILLYRFGFLPLTGETWKSRTIAAVLATAFFLAGRGSVALNSVARSRYGASYEFNTATTAFGLLTGTRLDLEYLLFGNGASGSFRVSDPAPQAETQRPGAGSLPATEPEPVPTEEPTAKADGPAEPNQPQEPEPEAAKEYGDNALELDFAALSQTETDPTVAATHSYVATLTPSRQNEYTGLFSGKNLIFITAEAFSKEVIDPVLTPTLYRMYTKGICFTDYYQPAWGGSTSTGEYSNLTGLVPTYGVSSMLESAENNMYFTLGNQLRRLGYFSRAYHPHTYTYYDRDLTHENLGYERYIGLGNGLEDKITEQWPESDLELMEATVDDYIDCRPFSIYYMTVSGHAEYNWKGNAMSQKHQQQVEELDAPESVKAYLTANLELESAMTYLLDRLEEAGIAEDTVIVLGTDHYPYGLESLPSEEYSSALEDLYGFSCDAPWDRDHSALLIWSGCLEGEKPIVVDDPVYSLDIVPTVSNLMGLAYDSRLLAGRDALSDTAPLVLWGDYSWITDRARYNAQTGQYTVREGCEDLVDEAYYAAVRDTVANKILFSKNVLDTDYYEILFGHERQPGEGVLENSLAGIKP